MDDVKLNLTPILHVDSYGNKLYCLPNGKTHHREDGPAVEYANGVKEWWLNGKLHRVDGPAVEHANGNKCWSLNGKLHREDGPAVEYIDEYKGWWINGKLHREDGPAIEYANGDRRYFLNGKEYPFEEWQVARSILWML